MYERRHRAYQSRCLGTGALSKYHSRKTEVDGHLFDSAAEARRYQELGLLQVAGEIGEIELQPVFVLLDPFTHAGKRYRGIRYVADFRYRVFGHGEVVEDVKGKRTAVYLVKRQLLLAKYPGIDFREIDAH